MFRNKEMRRGKYGKLHRGQKKSHQELGESEQQGIKPRKTFASETRADTRKEKGIR